jgi:tetraacyldisaccharide 4'-kinase
LKPELTILSLFKAPLAALFWLAVCIRHCLYDWNFLRQREFKFPVICVGNLAVGGTGKTPHVLLLLQILAEHGIAAAVLSRGYKRRSKGFRYVEANDNADSSGDEPLLIKRRHPNAVVAVCADRAAGIERIVAEHPTVKVVLLDDAFQHRRVKAGLSIVLTTYDRLATHDYMLPLGHLRDLPSRLRHADIVVVSKCPPTLKPIDFNLLAKHLKPCPYQLLYFSSYRYAQPILLSPSDTPQAAPPLGSEVIAVAGVANPQPFFAQLQHHFQLLQTLTFSDHHRFSRRDILRLESLHESYPQCAIIATEKDAVRLAHLELSASLRSKLYYLPIDVQVINNNLQCFTQKIINYVTANKRVGRLY